MWFLRFWFFLSCSEARGRTGEAVLVGGWVVKMSEGLFRVNACMSFLVFGWRVSL